MRYTLTEDDHTAAGWFLSPQYRDKEKLVEIRYRWQRGGQLAYEIRARYREDLDQLLGATKKQNEFDKFVRFIWGYSIR